MQASSSGAESRACGLALQTSQQSDEIKPLHCRCRRQNVTLSKTKPTGPGLSTRGWRCSLTAHKETTSQRMQVLGCACTSRHPLRAGSQHRRIRIKRAPRCLLAISLSQTKQEMPTPVTQKGHLARRWVSVGIATVLTMREPAGGLSTC